MKKQPFSIRGGEKVREQLTQKRLYEIRAKYETLYDDVVKQILRKNGTITEKDLRELKQRIESQFKIMNNDLENDLLHDIKTVALDTVDKKREYLSAIGFEAQQVNRAFFYVPALVTSSIEKGTIYQEGWTLSAALWGDSMSKQKRLQKIISNGAIQGKSAYEIAKDLESYVLPESRKKSRVIQSWRIDKNGKKVRDSFYFGKVDYNAQRLARTMISHAYQQSFMITNEQDPFIIGYKWLTSNFHGRVCEICRKRSEQNDYKLGIGVFPKDKLPLDHPNGMCTFVAVFDESKGKIEDRIGNWIQAPYGTYPEIDRFAESFLRRYTE